MEGLNSLLRAAKPKPRGYRSSEYPPAQCLTLARLSPLEEGIPRNWLIIRNPIQEVCTKSAGVSL